MPNRDSGGRAAHQVGEWTIESLVRGLSSRSVFNLPVRVLKFGRLGNLSEDDIAVDFGQAHVSRGPEAVGAGGATLVL